MAITDHNPVQDLNAWVGSAASMIIEMKRIAGLATDTELASFIGVSQPAVSAWRRRDGVPRAAVLQFQKKLLERDLDGVHGNIAARAIAMRVADFIHNRTRTRGSASGRWLAYSVVAIGLKDVVDAVTESLAKLHRETGRWTLDLAQELIEDERYLSGLADWIEGRAAADLIAGDAPWRRLPEDDGSAKGSAIE